MNIVAIIGLALVAAALSVFLRQYKPEYSLMVGLLAGAGILIIVLLSSLPILDELKALASAAGISTEYLAILVKALGISYLAQFTADACSDAGEKSLASKVELAGRVAILLVAFPLFRQIIDVVVELAG